MSKPTITITFEGGETAVWTLRDEDEALFAATMVSDHYGAAELRNCEGVPDASEAYLPPSEVSRIMKPWDSLTPGQQEYYHELARKHAPEVDPESNVPSLRRRRPHDPPGPGRWVVFS